MSVAIDATSLTGLAGEVSGPVLAPSDEGYDAARSVHNGLIDRRPAVIVRAHRPEDVVAALGFARRQGLEVSVRGGGHNVAGRSVTNGGLMIDLAEMRRVDVDADARTARAQGGALWADVNDAAAVHGLAVTGGAISTTGIGGYTLGGGLGWLMAKHGLACDNLVAAEVVTADARPLHASAEEHPDLFWGLRGGGGNFGVATAFTYRVHPHATITGGLIAHPVDAAPELLRFYRDAAPECSDDLTVFAALAHAPDGSGLELAAMMVFHTGDEETAERDLAPFKAWGSPLMVEVGPMPYPVMNTILDAAYPPGLCNYWLSSFTDGLSDGLIDVIVDRFASVPSPMTTILLEHFHGAVTRISPTATAVPHRSEGWNLLLPSIWPDPEDTPANVAWTQETFAALRPHFRGGRWLNYLADDQGEDAIRGAYGPNYDRLVALKRRVDPENVFHHNHNIEP